MKKLAASLAIVTLAALAQPAAAQDDEGYSKDTWPLAVTQRPLVLIGGMLEIRGDTLRINLSKDLVGDPVQIAPSIYYGVNRQLTVGITHMGGICVAGDTCDKAYNDITLDALYGFMTKGNFQVAAHGGVALPAFSPDLVAGLNLGLLARIAAGSIAVVLDPRLYVGVIQRDTMKETLYLPVQIQLQANGQTNVYVESGISGPLDHFGDFYTVPVGLGATFAVNNRLDFGAEFLFLNLAGKGSSADYRMVIARLALRL